VLLKYNAQGSTRHVLLKYNARGTTKCVFLKYNAWDTTRCKCNARDTNRCVHLSVTFTMYLAPTFRDTKRVSYARYPFKTTFLLDFKFTLLIYSERIRLKLLPGSTKTWRPIRLPRRCNCNRCYAPINVRPDYHRYGVGVGEGRGWWGNGLLSFPEMVGICHCLRSIHLDRVVAPH